MNINIHFNIHFNEIHRNSINGGGGEILLYCEHRLCLKLQTMVASVQMVLVICNNHLQGTASVI